MADDGHGPPMKFSQSRDDRLVVGIAAVPVQLDKIRKQQDRKSTRLNSSHVKISYAVFCLKKKKSFVCFHYLTSFVRVHSRFSFSRKILRQSRSCRRRTKNLHIVRRRAVMVRLARIDEENY